jgi:hypothetical protein
MGLGFPTQQRVRIRAGAMGLVAELDAAEISFRPLPAGLWSTKALARARWRRRRIVLPIDSLQRGMGRPGLQQGAIHREVLIAEQRLDFRCAISFARKRPMICSFINLSLFLVNVVGCQIGSSGLSPTNQRNSRL